MTPAELLARSLQQVAPAHRERLDLEISPAARRPGHLVPALHDAGHGAAEPDPERRRSGRLRRHGARAAADRGGHLSRPDGQRTLRIELADDAAGIAAEDLPKLFQKGYSTKSQATNSGLGLHWCANTLRALGGGISVHSEGSGPRHPIRDPGPPARAEFAIRGASGMSAKQNAENPIRILVADDEPAIREAYRPGVWRSRPARGSGRDPGPARPPLQTRCAGGRRGPPRHLRSHSGQQRGGGRRRRHQGDRRPARPTRWCSWICACPRARMAPGPPRGSASSTPTSRSSFARPIPTSTRSTSAARCRRRTRSPSCRSPFTPTKCGRWRPRLHSKWRAERHIARLAYFDSLTGLPNREHTMQRLTGALQHAAAGGHTTAVLYIDLDNFKRINDTLGPQRRR